MEKLIYVILALAFITAAVFFIFIKEAPEICINEKCFNVKIADSEEERAEGLMFIKELEENSGMIFLFEKSGSYSFWMKNTLIPLDIIWIDENKTIVHMSKNNLPCNETCETITGEKEAKYILEINAGLADKYDFNTGDNVWFHLV